MKVRRALLLVVVWCVLATMTIAQQRGPSTPEERAKAVRLAHQLENAPLGETAQEDRKWLLRWIDEVPDITVNICPTLLQPLLETNRNFAHEIWLQVMFSSAAFLIEHPDKTADDGAVYLAGVQGALKVYQNIQKVRPQAHWSFLDELIQKRDKGELERYVRDKVDKECSPDREPV